MSLIDKKLGKYVKCAKEIIPELKMISVASMYNPDFQSGAKSGKIELQL